MNGIIHISNFLDLKLFYTSFKRFILQNNNPESCKNYAPFFLVGSGGVFLGSVLCLMVFKCLCVADCDCVVKFVILLTAGTYCWGSMLVFSKFP